jgi:hypothetical protein
VLELMLRIASWLASFAGMQDLLFALQPLGGF